MMSEGTVVAPIQGDIRGWFLVLIMSTYCSLTHCGVYMNNSFSELCSMYYLHYNTTNILCLPTEELQLQADQKAAVDTEVEVLRSQVQQLQADLEEAHSAVTIAQCTAENDVAVEQRKCQEEIATVHQLMKGKRQCSFGGKEG